MVKRERRKGRGGRGMGRMVNLSVYMYMPLCSALCASFCFSLLTVGGLVSRITE